jgi:hypothetical protein
LAFHKGSKQRIGEAQRHQILDGLLAQIMIDAIDAILRENLADRFIDGARRSQILADRLFDHDTALRRHQIVLADPLADRPKRSGEVAR